MLIAENDQPFLKGEYPVDIQGPEPLDQQSQNYIDHDNRYFSFLLLFSFLAKQKTVSNFSISMIIDHNKGEWGEHEVAGQPKSQSKALFWI